MTMRHPIPTVSLALCLGPATACIGDATAPESPSGSSWHAGPDPFSCDAAEALELSPLEDFELGVVSGYYVSSDGSEGSVVEPAPGSTTLPATPIEGGRCGVSTAAFRLTGTGLVHWGMSFGTNFPGGPIDLQKSAGIAFWARRGPTAGRSLFFAVSDPYTDQGAGHCSSDSAEMTDKCDPYGTGIGLSEQWRFFQVPWAALRQRGFGRPTQALLVDQIVGLNWSVEAGDWEVWIDDVSVY